MSDNNDPVMIALLRRAGGLQDDEAHDSAPDDEREDPVLAAGGDLISAVKQGNAEGVAQAVQVMVEAILGRAQNGR